MDTAREDQNNTTVYCAYWLHQHFKPHPCLTYLWEIIIYLLKVWNSGLKAKAHHSIHLPSGIKQSTELTERKKLLLFLLYNLHQRSEHSALFERKLFETIQVGDEFQKNILPRDASPTFWVFFTRIEVFKKVLPLAMLQNPQQQSQGKGHWTLVNPWVQNLHLIALLFRDFSCS